MNFGICKNPVTKIYALVDPNDNTIRYIGASTNPEQRLSAHVQMNVGSDAKNNWIRGLKNKGQQPSVRILATCATSERKEQENKWILKMRAAGHNLYNVIYPGYSWHEAHGKTPKPKRAKR